MSSAETAMDTGPKTPRALSPWLQTALEYGPIAAYLVIYLIFRNDSFTLGGATYSGFVAITAAFVPVFLLATGALWWLTGRITRLQVVLAGMLVLFGGLGAALNDPTLFKMKPTAIYLLLGTILAVGLWRGQSWLKFVMEDMIPLKKKGWMILTKRFTALFFAAAAANELVWRTQSEPFWVIFETIAMPIIVLLFFLAQIRLFVDYATWGKPKKGAGPKNGPKRNNGAKPHSKANPQPRPR